MIIETEKRGDFLANVEPCQIKENLNGYF